MLYKGPLGRRLADLRVECRLDDAQNDDDDVDVALTRRWCGLTGEGSGLSLERFQNMTTKLTSEGMISLNRSQAWVIFNAAAKLWVPGNLDAVIERLYVRDCGGCCQGNGT
jgi:hypothetical protein